MATDLEGVSSIFDPRRNNGNIQEQKVDALVKIVQQLVVQHQKASQVLDNVSECLSTLLYCLEQGNLTFESFQKTLPEISVKRMEAVLAQMFASGVASQLTEVETDSHVMVSGFVGEEKKTLRRTFAVTESENSSFLGKKVGDRVKVSPEDQEVFEVLTIYKIGNFTPPPAP